MNRNTVEHFGHIPKIHQNRSKFDRSFSHKTSFNNGDIIPIYCDEILPGDTVQMDVASLVRMATPIYPVMDNMVEDIYFFFVPARLLWDNFKGFFGENDDPWTQTTEYEVPQLIAPEGGWEKGTIMDYMGIPTYVSGISVNALPVRAYCKVYNDWFRNENLKACCHIYTDETTRTGSNSGDYVLNTELGGRPCKAAKIHDYFTSALPDLAKGPDVTIPLGTKADVYTGPNHAINKQGTNDKYCMSFGAYNAMTGEVQAFDTNYIFGSTMHPDNAWSLDLAMDVSDIKTPPSGTGEVLFAPNNLYTDLSNATAATISELRTAFALQKYFEAQAMYGSRYIEYVRAIFGCESSDARMQRAEYLGGVRIPVSMQNIVKTSGTDEVSPQGNASGYSCTISKDSLFTKSFEEHGYILGLVVTRVEHSYQQGIHKMWSRKKMTDFYNPFFAHLSNQAILSKELFATGSSLDDEVFGYQEAWAEYRYPVGNRVSSAMRSNNPNGSLDAWHYADDYETRPYLDGTWQDEGYENVDRTIAVQAELEDQLLGDFYFKTFYTRCMPVYSVPGLIDHV